MKSGSIRPDDEETKKVADMLYEELMEHRVEVIYDDREGVRGGQMFADADLIGAPIRVIVSPRNLKTNEIEVTTRDKKVNERMDVSQTLAYVLNLREKMFEKLS